jgi:hypothetical protein
VGSLLEMFDDGWSIPRPHWCYVFELQIENWKFSAAMNQSQPTEREREREREREMEWNWIELNWIFVAQEGKTIKSCHWVADLSPSIVAQEEFNHVVVEMQIWSLSIDSLICVPHAWMNYCEWDDGIQNKFGLSSLFAC